MPSALDLKRLAQLEDALGPDGTFNGAFNGVSKNAVAVVELPLDADIPVIELEGFDKTRGLLVVIRSAAIPEGAHRATVNNEWRSGLPAISYDASAQDYSLETAGERLKARQQERLDLVRRWNDAQDGEAPARPGISAPPDTRDTSRGISRPRGWASTDPPPPDPPPPPPPPSLGLDGAIGARGAGIRIGNPQ